MKNIFNQTWKYFAGGATVLGYSAWFDRMKNAERALAFKKEINSNFDSVKDKISDLQEQMSSTVDSETKKQLTEKIQELNKELKSMRGIHNKYFEKFENGSVSADSDASVGLYEKYKTEINEAFTKADNKANEIADVLSKTKDKFMDNNPIFDIINDFKEYLFSLSVMEICLVINITSCVFILTCIISILSAVFGNYLIDRFSLEQKFPKLSRIIQLRVKLQRYYVIINSVLIILAVFSLIIVNTITLING